MDSPAVRRTSTHVLLSIVANFNLELEQLDVKKTFLYCDLDEEILIKQPKGFEVPGKERWFDSFMVSHKFDRNLYDFCVYHSKLEVGFIIYLLLYINGMMVP